MHQQLTGHITPADKTQSDYFYIPFDLPFAAQRLQVRYCYSAAMSSDEVTGGNVIDLGIFDPRGATSPVGWASGGGAVRRATSSSWLLAWVFTCWALSDCSWALSDLGGGR